MGCATGVAPPGQSRGMKTVRFATVVAAAGKPAPHPLWMSPGRDRVLQQALKAHRVMTVHQDVRGTRKDYGTVGMTQEPEAQHLVFPRSLRKFEGQRIVGIDYGELADGASLASTSTADAPAAPVRGRPRAKSEPRPRPVKARRAGKTDVVPFEPPRAAAPKPRVVRTSRAQEPVPRKVVQEVRRAAVELQAGKAVAAYERLQALLRQLDSA
jgi:hypothetical protein